MEPHSCVGALRAPPVAVAPSGRHELIRSLRDLKSGGGVWGKVLSRSFGPEGIKPASHPHLRCGVAPSGQNMGVGRGFLDFLENQGTPEPTPLLGPKGRKVITGLG